jgi:hypothetical protein
MHPMDELPVPETAQEQDADAPLARDRSYYFKRQLGEDWQEEEPGIYRHVSTDDAE